MANQTNNPSNKPKPVKIIKNAQDIQEVKQFDRIDLEYYHFIGSSLFNKEAFFSGSFDVDDKRYFVITRAEPSKIYPSYAYMASGLYKVGEKEIMFSGETMSGHCPTPEYDKYENPKNQVKPGSLLEGKIKEHFSILKKQKLNKIGKENKR